jgi:hypothetical protein
MLVKQTTKRFYIKRFSFIFPEFSTMTAFAPDGTAREGNAKSYFSWHFPK